MKQPDMRITNLRGTPAKCLGIKCHPACTYQAFLGGGDVRVGEFILLVDSDTRIPRDCILPTIFELLASPQVAFTQHLITPMQVRNYYNSGLKFALK